MLQYMDAVEEYIFAFILQPYLFLIIQATLQSLHVSPGNSLSNPGWKSLI